MKTTIKDTILDMLAVAGDYGATFFELLRDLQTNQATLRGRISRLSRDGLVGSNFEYSSRKRYPRYKILLLTKYVTPDNQERAKSQHSINKLKHKQRNKKFGKGHRNWTTQRVRQHLLEHGFHLNSEYKGDRTKISFTCIKRGHTYHTNLSNFNKAPYCGKCQTLLKKYQQEKRVRHYLESLGCKLVSGWTNARTPIGWECPNGHLHYSPFPGFTRPLYCTIGQCSKSKITIEVAKQKFSNLGMVLLDNVIPDPRQKIHFICSCGKDGFDTYQRVVNDGKKCKDCNHAVWQAKIDATRLDPAEAQRRKFWSQKIRRVLKRHLKTTKQRKDNKTYKMLGYDAKQLREHIETHQLDLNPGPKTTSL